MILELLSELNLSELLILLFDHSFVLRTSKIAQIPVSNVGIPNSDKEIVVEQKPKKAGSKKKK